MLNVRKINESQINEAQVKYNGIINKWEITTKETLNYELAYETNEKNVYYCNTSDLIKLPIDADLITY